MVSIKHKVTLKTKVAQEETFETAENHKVTLKRKQTDVPITPESNQQVTSTPTASKIEPQSTSKPVRSSNTSRIIGSLVVVAVIIIGIFFFMHKENEGDNTKAPIEAIAQNTETKESDNKSLASGTANKDAVSKSDGVVSNDSEGAVSVNTEDAPTSNEPAVSTVSARDNKAEGLPTKQNSATIAKTTKSERSNTQSKSVVSQVSKPSSATSASLVSGDVEENARRVIRGDFGNGQRRKEKLGSSYSEIQGRVNEMYRQGLVH